MSFNITFGSDQSFSDEEDSSVFHGSPPSDSGSHDYQDPYDRWADLPYPDELKPSDSASRPRTSNRTRSRHSIQGSRSASGRRQPLRRHFVQEREPFHGRQRRTRPPSPESPESADSAEEYERPSLDTRYWPPMAHGPGYANSPFSGPPYPYSHGGVPQRPLGHSGGSHSPSDQLIRLGHTGQINNPNPYGSHFYQYGTQPHVHTHGAPISPFFVHDHPGNPGRYVHHARREAYSPPPHSLPHPSLSHGQPSYGGTPFNTHELMPYNPGGYYPFREPFPVSGVVPPYAGSYSRVRSPQVEPSPSPVPPPSDAAKDVAKDAAKDTAADTAKDEAIARLEKLIMEERSEREAREAREAARQAAIEQEAAEQAAKEERAAHEKQIAEDAAAAARAEAEQKAAEEAAQAKKEAEEAAAAAASEAAAAATEAANAAAAEAVAAATAAASNQPPTPEKKKPIKFKDAVGRKFNFPFELCCTWRGMEELIRQAFHHIEVIGPHVADGHYDLVGPNGDIILPQVWDTVIEPDWTITMHMWPIPENPKTPEPVPPEVPVEEPAAAAEASEEPPVPEAREAPEAPPAVEVPAPSPDEAAVVPDEPKKTGTKKQRQKGPDPGAFTMWVIGGNRLRLNKSISGKKA